MWMWDWFVQIWVTMLIEIHSACQCNWNCIANYTLSSQLHFKFASQVAHNNLSVWLGRASRVWQAKHIWSKVHTLIHVINVSCFGRIRYCKYWSCTASDDVKHIAQLCAVIWHFCIHIDSFSNCNTIVAVWRGGLGQSALKFQVANARPASAFEPTNQSTMKLSLYFTFFLTLLSCCGADLSVREESDNDQNHSDDADPESSPTKSPTTPKNIKCKNSSGTFCSNECSGVITTRQRVMQTHVPPPQLTLSNIELSGYK